MPMPEGAALNQGFSPILTNFALNFIPKLTQFIAKQVFPNVPVASPSGLYNIWKQGDFYRRSMKKLGNYEAPPVGGFSTSSGTFTVGKYGISTAYTAQDLAEARRGGTSDQMLINAKTQYVTIQSVLELEIQTATLVQTSGNWTTTRAGVTSAPSGSQFIQWDQAASQPIDDIIAYIEVMRLLTGFAPNTLVIPIQVMNVLRRNAQVISRITYGGTMAQPTQISLQVLKDLFGVDNILVPEGVYNTAAEGQTDALTYIWNKNVWLGYVAASPSMETPSAGYHFSWMGDTTLGLPAGMGSGAGPNDFGSVMNPEGMFIRYYQMLRPNAQFIDSELFTTPNVVGADLGMTLTAAVA